MNNIAEQIERLFGSYRAEYFHASYGPLFIAPPYFSELEAERPTLLVGGRGTGKTTALRSLRFDALEARGLQQCSYLGIYVRINKNRVYAFDTTALPAEKHRRLFAHYFNLLVAIELCELASWMEKRNELHPLNHAELGTITSQFCLGDVEDVSDLANAVNGAIVALEVYVNNIDSTEANPPLLSVAEAPVKSFVSLLNRHDPHRRAVFCCIDEYENLLTVQQAVVNTYIKHSELPLSYKVGIKTNGLRTRDTIDNSDPLNAPADYTELDIVRETTDDFLMDVIGRRLQAAIEGGLPLASDLQSLLPGLSIQDEAELLGAKRIGEEIRDELAIHADLKSWLTSKPDGQLYFLKFWHESQLARKKMSQLEDLARDWCADPQSWEQRIGNYGYASLFWLSQGRKGARIRKYYCGSSTFLALANGNIRFFLQLVHQALRACENKDRFPVTVSPKDQTVAAQHVATYHLNQLDGLCTRGGEIKRLVLAIGKVFFELTRQPLGHQPEPATFILSGAPGAVEQVTSLLQEGVVHLALDVSPRTKATTQTEIQDDEYRLHPILAPFFEITHRRKRRIVLDAELLGQVNTDPGRAIRQLLKNAHVTPDKELPAQLAFFEAFYTT